MAKLQYKDDKGNIGEGQSITDLSRNNILIKRGIKVLWYFAGITYCIFSVSYLAYSLCITK